MGQSVLAPHTSAALLTGQQLGDQPMGTLSICNRDRCNRYTVILSSLFIVLMVCYGFENT